MMTKFIPITLQSATWILAYCQHYTCKYFPGRCLTNTHLRRMASWIKQPNASLRSIRQHPALAAHIALLQAAKLLAHNEMNWYLTPAIFSWLDQPASGQYRILVEAIEGCHYQTAIKALGLSDTVPIDRIAFVLQQLKRQWQNPQSTLETGKATWQHLTPDAWQLHLPTGLPSPHLFHLLQIGEWMVDETVLCITPLTIIQAARHGYSLTHINCLLTEATDAPLSLNQQQQLLDWYGRDSAYQLHTVTLLTTKQPEQLASIIRNGNLRPHLQKQLSPRHAIVSTTIQPSLEKWVARQGYLLDTSLKSSWSGKLNPTDYQWLGLHVLTALGQLIPLPYPPPHHELALLSSHISPEVQAQLIALSNQIMTTLQDAINGRDAFFPARSTPLPQFIAQIKQALQTPKLLTFSYRTLHALEPKQHTVEPLRLEKRGQLYYLHAYSYRAEANLTFRLDRIEEILQSK